MPDPTFRARRAFLSESIEALAGVSAELRSAVLLSEDALAHSALSAAESLEALARNLRAGAEALGVEPRPVPPSRSGLKFAG
jgi:hypothetical protein